MTETCIRDDDDDNNNNSNNKRLSKDMSRTLHNNSWKQNTDVPVSMQM
jgi:hypothetical protein